jgi:hypothetical protein
MRPLGDPEVNFEQNELELKAVREYPDNRIGIEAD